MDAIKQHPWLVTGGAIVTLAVTRKLLSKKAISEWPKDKVVLHCFARGPWAPSLSPFVLKLETYLRMAKIPYETDIKNPMGEKGKSPWISYNGEDIADSQFCIEYLNEKFNVDLNSNLTAHQKATGLALRALVEDNLLWVLACERYLFDEKRQIETWIWNEIPVPWLIIPLFLRRGVKKLLYGVGMGRHSREQVIHIGKQNLDAISELLGEKDFLFGDKVTEYDAAMFGMLGQIMWHLFDSSLERHLKEKTTNLVRYCERVKKTFWPDWDDKITHGLTKLENRPN